ncbi:MAG: hypothetical protein Q8P64_02430 [Deltaproteobacteria bacterium]|nr:hypothetical protein [Deltaproteobacteria bacterium]
MTSLTATSGYLDRRKRAAATATTLAVILMLKGEEILSSQYYPLNPPFSSGYPWEIRDTYSQASRGEFAAPEEFQIIQQFVTKIVTQSKDLDPRYDQLISENFWELV